jgi:DNA-directed RNA polymerase subunit M/transcription elongation factor TFIIS
MEREIYRQLIMGAMEHYPGWAEQTAENRVAIARRIERSCYNKVIDQCAAVGVTCAWNERRFTDRYSAECYRIIINIDPTSSIGSKYLGELILAGKIDLNSISNMTNYELNPESSKAERDEINLRNEQKVEIKVSKTNRCAKCGGRETTMIPYQGRAADEDVNISVKCINCNAVWRK